MMLLLWVGGKDDQQGTNGVTARHRPFGLSGGNTYRSTRWETRTRGSGPLLIAEADEIQMVGERIEAALRDSPDWRVLTASPRPLATGEHPLARRLIAALA